jgi:ATP-dependent helicase HrpB
VVDLAGLVLELAVWGSAPGELPFLDQPPPAAWSEGVDLLTELGAIDHDGRPTVTGRSMIDLPLHPRLARMVVDGRRRGQGWPASVLAAVLDERDVLTGRRDDRPADLAERVSLVAGHRTEASARANRDAQRVVARRARELARRATIRSGPVDPTVVGPLVALAYPDRIAQSRSTGRFRLRAGGGGWLPDTDPLAPAPFLAVADLDVGTGDGRIRSAAALDADDVIALVGHDVETATTLVWDHGRDDLRARSEARSGALVLWSSIARAEPGDATVVALVDRVRDTGGALLRWTDAAQSFRARLGFVRRADSAAWPDVSDEALLADLETWLAPHLVGARGRADVARVDLVRVLRSLLDHRQVRELDRLAPVRLQLGNGRSLAVAYGGDAPAASARVQDLYGTTSHPTVAGGRVPVVVEALSPAGRPIQVTADLPGFWAGSWREVRKEMAGRYPKHDWPPDPATAGPHSRGRRRR